MTIDPSDIMTWPAWAKCCAMMDITHRANLRLGMEHLAKLERERDQLDAIRKILAAPHAMPTLDVFPQLAGHVTWIVGAGIIQPGDREYDGAGKWLAAAIEPRSVPTGTYIARPIPAKPDDHGPAPMLEGYSVAWRKAGETIPGGSRYSRDPSLSSTWSNPCQHRGQLLDDGFIATPIATDHVAEAQQPPAEAVAALAKLPGKWRIVGKQKTWKAGWSHWMSLDEWRGCWYWATATVDSGTRHATPNPVDEWWAEPIPVVDKSSTTEPARPPEPECPARWRAKLDANGVWEYRVPRDEECFIGMDGGLCRCGVVMEDDMGYRYIIEPIHAAPDDHVNAGPQAETQPPGELVDLDALLPGAYGWQRHLDGSCEWYTAASIHYAENWTACHRAMSEHYRARRAAR